MSIRGARRTAASTAVACLLLSACAEAASPVAEPTHSAATDRPVEPARTELSTDVEPPTIPTDDPDGLAATAAAGERAILDAVLGELGIDRSGPIDSILDEATAINTERLANVLDAPPVNLGNDGPAGFAWRAAPDNPSQSAGSVAPVQAASTLGLTALATLIMMTRDDHQHGSSVGDGFDQQGPFRTTRPGRAAGRTAIGPSTVTRDGITMSADVVADFDTEFCPDPGGLVHGEATFDVRVDIDAGDGQRSATYHLGSSFTTQVDADATAGAIDFDIAGSIADVHTSTVGGRPRPDGAFLELRLTGAHDASSSTASLTQASVVRASRSVTDALAQSFSDDVFRAAVAMTILIVKVTEQHWRSGKCVRIDLDPEAGPDGVVPEQRIGVHITSTAVTDEQPTGGTITTTLTAGGDGVEPDGIAQPAPADVTYTAPPVSGGTITAESVSRRGIGRGALTFTAEPGWVVDGTDGVFQVHAVKCDGAAGRWRFELSATFDGGTFHGEVIAELDPTTLTGPFTLTGSSSGGGITIPQAGSGTMTFVHDDTTGFITFTSDSWSSGSVAGGNGGPGQLSAIRATTDQCA